MRLDQIKQTARKRIVLVWDGTSDFMASAEREIAARVDAEILAIHVLPTEGLAGKPRTLDDDPGYAKTIIRTGYDLTVRNSKRLGDTRLRLLIGDRLSKIVEYAKEQRADLILLPPFQQSNFSKWIHGDLNQQLENRAPCPVKFLKPCRISMAKRLRTTSAN